MARIVKIFKTIRTHWKKSTFLAIAVAYGTNYTVEHFQTHDLMRTYCLEAKKYGDAKIPDGISPKNITVILNPTANRRKAAKQFEKYCAPILHLAGVCVDVVQTESEGHARSLVEKLKSTDAIIIAGGDGTVSEVITGLLRRTEDDRHQHPCPIGILPLGQTNSLGKVLFPGGESLATVKSLADASLAIVEQNTKLVDVMRVEIIQSEPETKIDISASEDPSVTSVEKENEVKDEDSKPKPIYALASLEWGAFRDAQAKQDKYWYWGSLRKYATYIFNGYKNSLTWSCNADINYLEPCEGCSQCYVARSGGSRWWLSWMWSRPRTAEKDYSKVKNERCRQEHSRQVATSDFILRTANVLAGAGPELQLSIGPTSTGYLEFVQEGFRTVRGEERHSDEQILARQLELFPHVDLNAWYSIDREEYEARPVRVTLLPRVLKVFCKAPVT